jgi:hypothetical protein
MSYVDAFISHYRTDMEKARALEQRIKGWGFSCFIDGDDAELAKKKENRRSVEDDLTLAAYIRGKLRDCRCIIYAYSASSPQSRWMQWELGFFDGRWGPRQIGRYDLDEGRADGGEGDARKQDVLEYLHVYEELRPETLRDFLRGACSTRALADRADVDVDRLATLLTAKSRDPVNFTLDAWAYLTALQRQFWSRWPAVFPALGPAGRPPEAPWAAMKAAGGFRDLWQPFAEAMKPPERLQRRNEALTRVMREDGEKALHLSR